MPWLVWAAALGIVALIALLSRGGPTRIPGGLAFGRDITPDEARAVYELGQRLQIDPSFLMVQFFMESRLHPQAHLNLVGYDEQGRAIYQSFSTGVYIDRSTVGGGLVGFIRSTAKSLGYTLEEILDMDFEEQLIPVEKMYMRMKLSGILPAWPTLKRLRLATYYPAKAKLSEQPEAILWDSHSPDKRERKAYFGNPWADKNKDGLTTVEEALSQVENVLKKGLSKKHFLPDSARKAA